MTAQKLNYSNFFETTADGNIGASDTSITLSAAPTSDGTSAIAGPFYLVIDPDSLTKREVVLVSSISGVIADVTGGRDVEGRHATDPSHADGTTIRMAVVGEMFEDTNDRIDDIALTGDVTGTINSSTQDIATSIGSGVIVDADVNASAAIAQSKLNLAVTTSEIAADTLVTEAEGITSNDNDTTLPTSAAVKDYVDNNVTTASYSVYDAYGLTSDRSGTGNIPSWTALGTVGGSGINSIGSAVSHSSGVFTFPETGIYKIVVKTHCDLPPSCNFRMNTQVTNNNSTYTTIASSGGSWNENNEGNVDVYHTALIEVNSTPNDKVRFNLSGTFGSYTRVRGNASRTETFCSFTKVADI
jgi:hypothetical protein